MCCPSDKVIKSDRRSCPLIALRRVIRRQVMRHFTINGTDQCQNGSLNILTPYREQPRFVVAYPRPAFSATKRTNTLQSVFDQQAQASRSHTSYRNTEVHNGGGLERVKPAREPALRRPKPCASLKSPTNLTRSPLLVGPRRTKTDRGQRSAFP